MPADALFVLLCRFYKPVNCSDETESNTFLSSQNSFLLLHIRLSAAFISVLFCLAFPAITKFRFHRGKTTKVVMGLILQKKNLHKCIVSGLQRYLRRDAQLFSCEFCKISKNNLFTEHRWATASVIIQMQKYVVTILNVLYMFNLRPLSTGKGIIFNRWVKQIDAWDFFSQRLFGAIYM